MARTVAERGDAIPALGEVFREYGFEGASLRIISQRTGLGKGSLYHFFPGGKEEMAAAVLEAIAAWFEDKVYTPLGIQPPDRAVAAMFQTVEDYFLSGRRVCLVGAFALDDSRDRFPQAIRSYFLRWINALAGCLERGGTPSQAAARLACEVVSGIQGGIVLARALNESRPFLEMTARLRRDCATAMGKKPA